MSTKIHNPQVLYEFHRNLASRVQGKDPLRRRFGNALCWFNSLQSATDMHVKSLLEHTRSEMRHPPQSISTPPKACSRSRQASVEDVEDEDTLRHGASNPVDIEFTDQDIAPSQNARKRCHSSEDSFEAEGVHAAFDRPSEYLRSRCPVCFGGDFNQATKRLSLSDVIVCLDANFTQRHQTSRRDPARQHPDSFFLSDQEVKDAEARVESARDRRPAKKTKPEADDHAEDDHMEPGMRVSKAVLDLCGGSFTAAHEYLAKVVSAGYDVTGLMALLCRHDRPLFVVNMTTPGEPSSRSDYYMI
ncbi:hypothetical protein VKT23_016703 [Stygiomarasmius scandens]|uniref:Uncharacterized protein n=1 Tax=Marasmiellus scandens TaxID=2682957 RepID=A0ABR1IUG7_9AGAR